MKKSQMIAFLCLLLALFAGCAVSIDEVATRIVDNLTKNKEVFRNRRLAVIDFVILETGKETPLTKVVSENINTELIDKIGTLQGKLLERSQISAILKEYKFQFSDLADPKATKELGKALGADLVVIGTLSENHGQLNVRIVEIESYNIVGGARIRLSQRLFTTKEDSIETSRSTNFGSYKHGPANFEAAFAFTGVVVVSLIFSSLVLKKVAGKGAALTFLGVLSLLVILVAVIYSVSSIQKASVWVELSRAEGKNWNFEALYYGRAILYCIFVSFLVNLLIVFSGFASLYHPDWAGPSVILPRTFVGALVVGILFLAIRMVLIENWNIYEMFPLY